MNVPSAPPVEIDLRALEPIRALARPGTPSLLRRVVELYLRDAPGQLDAMSRAMARGDHVALQAASHALRSNGTFLGVIRLTELLARLERMARDRSTRNGEALFAEIVSAQHGVARELNALPELMDPGTGA